jgi:hypothetical protein
MKLFCLPALLAAARALATDCHAWRAGIEPDEGGPAMVASICAADRPDDLLPIT